MIRFVIMLAVAICTRLGHAEESLPLPKPLPKVKRRADPATVALGRKLFFDARLSSNDRISCATCHDPKKGFSNGERFALGVQGKRGTRNVPALYNVAHQRSFFWDGRVATLEEQALEPIRSPLEMNLPLDKMVEKLRNVAEYRREFQMVFDGGVTAKRVAEAIAAYERTIVSRDTPFDRYLAGDKKALSARAMRGLQLFYGEARCFVCHSGANLTDNKFHNVGFSEANASDLGRRAVTHKKSDHGKFKTPSLREVARTAPYGHNGRFKTLTEVVRHYNFGGVTDEANDYRDEELQVLYLSDEQVGDLVAFLKEGVTSSQHRSRHGGLRAPLP